MINKFCLTVLFSFQTFVYIRLIIMIFKKHEKVSYIIQTKKIALYEFKNVKS